LDIKEGIFYDKIEGFVIKVGKKEKDDSTIRSVVIYEKTFGIQDNFLVAKSGTMKVTPDQRFLEFTLRDGWKYEENGNRFSNNSDYIRLGFKEYKTDFDLSSFQMTRTEDSLFKWDPKMLTVHQLNLSMDSVKKLRNAGIDRLKSQLKPSLVFYKYKDSAWSLPDSLKKKSIKTITDIIPDSIITSNYERAVSSLNSVKGFVDLSATDFSSNQDLLRKNRVEWHRKFSLSFACVVMFMIGAPLGSIIRKGGLGSPLVFAVIFFVIFHLLNTFGEKFAKQGVAGVTEGMWLSAFVLVPVGIFLTSKAMRDSQLFNKEFYFRFFTNIKKVLAFKQKDPIN
jgi:lipopolysaccharide export system permease protein